MGCGTNILAVEGWILIVTNLDEETTEEDIMNYFGDFGTVDNIHLNLDRQSGYVKGYAFLEYRKYEQAVAAIEDGNGTELLGKHIRVAFAFVRNVDNDFTENKSKDQVENEERARSRSASPDVMEIEP